MVDTGTGVPVEHAGRGVTAIGTVLLAIVIAGCSSSGTSAKAKGKTAGSTSSTPGGGTSASGSSSPGGSQTTSGSGSGTVTVDLVITGDRPFTIKGTKGRCRIPSDNTLGSGYDFIGADYPSLGAGGAFSVEGPQLATAGGQTAFPANIKVIIKGGGLANIGGSGITLSADRKKVTLNVGLGGSTGGTLSNPGTPLHGHVTGTITCP
jgi:hypothetical protein